MDIRKQWDRWGWLIPAVIILVAAARLFFGREPFCVQNEHCLREWASALGGWAAVFAGVPSILYLAKQVRHAEESARAVGDQYLRRRRSVASATARLAFNLRELANVYGQPGYVKIGDPMARVRVMVMNLERLKDLLGQKMFETFEAEVEGHLGTDIDSQRRALNGTLGYLNGMVAGTYTLAGNEIDEKYYKQCQICANYGQDILSMSSRYSTS